MRYIYPITDINSYDIDLLAQEIRLGGLPLQAIHIGNGVLVFEFQDALTETEKTVMQGIIANHRPTWFEKSKVNCAEDVDKITAMRIRNLMGDDDPIQGQMAKLTMLIEGIYSSINAAASLAEIKTGLTDILQQHRPFLDMRRTIIQEGKTFKTGKGW